MRTRVLRTDSTHRKRSIAEAARLIVRGETVAFPTETVYGLGANALDGAAVRKIFIAKGRPPDNPLIVHLYSFDQLQDVALSLPVLFWRLADQFMPGPLTVVLRRTDALPGIVSAGLPTVAVRFPDHPIAKALLKAANVPIVAPSANCSGGPSPTRAQHVLDDLSGRIAAVLAGGRCRVGLESTVLDLTRRTPVILRPGAVTREEIEDALGFSVHVARPTHKRPASPGMKYQHYAPQAELLLFEGERNAVAAEMLRTANRLAAAGIRPGVMVEEELLKKFSNSVAFGFGGDLRSAARRLYEGLRSLDKQRVQVILCQGFDEASLGHAIMNRLRKAATRRIRV